MIRFLLNLAAMVSTVLFLAIVTVWTASPWKCCVGGLMLHNGEVQAAMSYRQSIYLFASNIRIDNGVWRADGAVQRTDAGDDLVKLFTNTPTFDRKFAGFRLLRGPKDAFSMPGAWFTLVVLPTWFAALITALLPALTLRKNWIYWRRKKTGACLHCGYDLRESKERCPECGQLIPGTPDRSEGTAIAQGA